MRHPFLALAHTSLTPLFRTFLAMTAAVAIAMIATGGALKHPLAPAGVFSLELNFGTLPAMMAPYTARQLCEVAFQLGIDFLFIPLYTTGLALGLMRTLAKRETAYPMWCGALLWALWLAGVCDAVENLFLYRACLDGATASLGWGATVFASVKFGILVVALLAWAFAAFMSPARRRS